MKIYEQGSFWFSALGQSLGKGGRKMIEDGLSNWCFSSFFMPVIPQNVPVDQSWACGALKGKNQGGRNNEGSHCLRGLPLRALNALHHHHHHHVCSFWKQHPDNRNPPSSDRCLASTLQSRLRSNLKAGASESHRGLHFCKYTSIFKPDEKPKRANARSNMSCLPWKFAFWYFSCSFNPTFTLFSSYPVDGNSAFVLGCRSGST